MKYCCECGRKLVDKASVCPKCGYMFQKNNSIDKQTEEILQGIRKHDEITKISRILICEFVCNILFALSLFIIFLLIFSLKIERLNTVYDGRFRIALVVITILNVILNPYNLYLYCLEENRKNILKYVSRIIFASLFLLLALIMY